MERSDLENYIKAIEAATSGKEIRDDIVNTFNAFDEILGYSLHVTPLYESNIDSVCKR